MPDEPFLNRDAVARIGGVKPGTVSRHLERSRPGQRHALAGDPFPVPDGREGKAPWWRLEREPEIRAWFERHQPVSPGRGWGGRPRKASSSG
jgi:hypothetical protein